MQLNKVVKLGLALASALVLGGMGAPVGGQFGVKTTVVHAEEMLYYKVQHMTWDLDNTYKIVLEESFPIYPGETKTISSHAKTTENWLEGWIYDSALEYDNDFTYDEVASGYKDVIVVMYTRPNGKVVEKKPITYTIRRFDYGNRVLIEEIPYTINPGETIQIVLKDIPGYRLRLGSHNFPVSYDSVVTNGIYSNTLLYDKIDSTSSSTSSSTKPSTKPSTSSSTKTSTSSPTKPSTKPAKQPTQSSVKVYRLYNPALRVHLYTKDLNEYKVLGTRGWKQENVSWEAATTGGKPVYRLYHPGLKVHLYTTDANENKVLGTRGWIREGEIFRSAGTVPIYRLYHKGIQRHLYTRDLNEYRALGKVGWQQEGVALYAQK